MTNHLNKLLEVEGVLLEDVHRARKSSRRDRTVTEDSICREREQCKMRLFAFYGGQGQGNGVTMVSQLSGSGSREVVLAHRPQSSSESGQLHVCAEIPMRRGVVVVTGPNSYPTNRNTELITYLIRPRSSSLEPTSVIATISQLSVLSLIYTYQLKFPLQSKGPFIPTL